jgi:acyl carrier protein
MSTEDNLRAFMVDELQCGREAEELTDDFPLLEGEVLDSLGIFQVVSFLENSLGVEVRDEELIPDNFATIGSIARLADSKLGPAG